jgi:hypothetical protein
MWMVNVNGSWQPADNDAVVFTWIAQGIVGAHTPIRHSSWPSPQLLGQVPAFAQVLGARGQTYPQSAGLRAEALRDHPSAQAALGLGLLALAIGPLGIPAILLGKKAQREIAASPTRYAGGGFALGGIALGWLGVLTFCFVAGIMLALSSRVAGVLLVIVPVLGVACGAVGHWAPSAPRLLRAVATSLIRSPAPSGVPLAVLVLAGAIGLWQGAAKETAAAESCSAAKLALQSSLSEDAYGAARKALYDVSANCSAVPLAEVNRITAEIEAREAAYNNRAAEDAKAKATAAKVASFPVQAEEANRSLAAEQSAVTQRKWDEADAALKDVERLLDGFRGTSIEKTQQWLDLRARAADERKRIQPQVDAYMKQADKRREAEEAQRRVTEAAGRAGALQALLGEYKDNEVRADMRYKGKVVTVAGTVTDVKRDLLGKMFVTIGTGQMFEIPEVQCFFEDEHARQAARLSKGDRATVRGTVQGLMMNVLVEDCEFVE